METLIEKSTFEIIVDKGRKFIQIKIKGFISASQHMEKWNRVKDEVISNRLDKMIIDGRNAKVTPVETQKWFEEVYFPHVAQVMKSMNIQLNIAQIEPEDIFQKLVNQRIDALMEKTLPGNTVKIFNNEKEAQDWLKLDK